MYTIGPDGKRQYTLKKIVDGVVAKSAHPARFSPDDKYSRYVFLRPKVSLEDESNNRPQASGNPEEALRPASDAAKRHSKSVLPQHH